LRRHGDASLLADAKAIAGPHETFAGQARSAQVPTQHVNNNMIDSAIIASRTPN